MSRNPRAARPRDPNPNPPPIPSITPPPFPGFRRPSIPMPNVIYSHRKSSTPDASPRNRLPGPSPPSKRLRDLAPPPITIPTLSPIEVPNIPAYYPNPPYAQLDDATGHQNTQGGQAPERQQENQLGKGKPGRPRMAPLRMDLMPPRMMYQPPLSDSPLDMSAADLYAPGVNGLYSKFSVSTTAGSGTSRDNSEDHALAFPFPGYPSIPRGVASLSCPPLSPSAHATALLFLQPTLGQALDGVRVGPNADRLAGDIPILLGGSLFRQFKAQEIKHARESIQRDDQAAFESWKASSAHRTPNASPPSPGTSPYATRPSLQYTSPYYPAIPKDASQDVLHVTPPTPQRTGALSLSPGSHMARYAPPSVLIDFRPDIFMPTTTPHKRGVSPSGTFGDLHRGLVDQSPKGKSRMAPLPPSAAARMGRRLPSDPKREDTDGSEFTVSAYMGNDHSRQSTFDAPDASTRKASIPVPPMPLERLVHDKLREEDRLREDSPASMALITPPQSQEDIEVSAFSPPREAQWFAGERNSRDVGPSLLREGCNALGLIDIDHNQDPYASEDDQNTARPSPTKFVSPHPYSSAYVPPPTPKYEPRPKAEGSRGRNGRESLLTLSDPNCDELEYLAQFRRVYVDPVIAADKAYDEWQKGKDSCKARIEEIRRARQEAAKIARAARAEAERRREIQEAIAQAQAEEEREEERALRGANTAGEEEQEGQEEARTADAVKFDDIDPTTHRRLRDSSWWRHEKQRRSWETEEERNGRIIAITERRGFEPLDDHIDWDGISGSSPLRIDTATAQKGMRRRCSTPVSPKTRKPGEKTPNPSLFRVATTNAGRKAREDAEAKGKAKERAKTPVRPQTSAGVLKGKTQPVPDTPAPVASGKAGKAQKVLVEKRPKTAQGVKEAYLRELAESRTAKSKNAEAESTIETSPEEGNTHRSTIGIATAGTSATFQGETQSTVTAKAEDDIMDHFLSSTTENARAISTDLYFVRFHPPTNSRDRRLSHLDISLSVREESEDEDEKEKGKDEGHPFLEQGVLEFGLLPKQSVSWNFGYSVMEAAPRLGRVTVNQMDNIDYLCRNAALKVKSEGMYALGGIEKRKHEFVEWKLQYSVRYRYSRTNEQIYHERIVVPTGFFCTPTFLHPEYGTKLSIASKISKALKPGVSATQISGANLSGPSALSLVSSSQTIRTGPSAVVSIDNPPSSANSIPSSNSTNGSLAKAVEAVVSAFRPTTPGKGTSSILGSRQPTPKAKERIKPGAGDNVPPMPLTSAANIATLAMSRPATAIPPATSRPANATPAPLRQLHDPLRPLTALDHNINVASLPRRIQEAIQPFEQNPSAQVAEGFNGEKKKGRFRAATLFSRRPATSTADLPGTAVLPTKASMGALRPSTATALLARQISPPLPAGSSNPAAAITSKWPFGSHLGSSLHLPVGGGAKRKNGRPTTANPTNPTIPTFVPNIPPRPTFTLGTTSIPADAEDLDDDIRGMARARMSARAELHGGQALPRAHPFSEHLVPIPSAPRRPGTAAGTSSGAGKRPLLTVYSSPGGSKRPHTAQSIVPSANPLPLRPRAGPGATEMVTTVWAGPGPGGLRPPAFNKGKGSRPSTAQPRLQTRI